MSRLTLVCTLLLATPAFAQSSAIEVEAELAVGAVFDDNAGLLADSATTEDLVTVTVSPHALVRVPLRWLDFSVAYRLTYFNYTKDGVVTNAPELLHDAKVSAALTVLEGLELQIEDRFQPVGLEYAKPHDVPENQTQQNVASVHTGLTYDFNRSTHAGVSYDAARVDYMDSDVAPAYLRHGPGLRVGLDVLRSLTLFTSYGFQIQDFDATGDATNQALSGDVQTHDARAGVASSGSEFTALDLSAGYQRISADNFADPVDGFAADLNLEINPTQFLGFKLGGNVGSTTDLAGNPAQQIEARLVTSIMPAGTVTLLIEGAYGQLDLESSNPAVGKTRQYFRGGATADYEFIRWVRLRAGYAYHSYDDGTDTISINRGFFALIAQYR